MTRNQSSDTYRTGLKDFRYFVLSRECIMLLVYHMFFSHKISCVSVTRQLDWAQTPSCFFFLNSLIHNFTFPKLVDNWVHKSQVHPHLPGGEEMYTFSHWCLRESERHNLGQDLNTAQRIYSSLAKTNTIFTPMVLYIHYVPTQISCN